MNDRNGTTRPLSSAGEARSGVIIPKSAQFQRSSASTTGTPPDFRSICGW
jgi:hypothetical protein